MTSTIRSPPALSDYVPLAEHQEKTPETFHGGKPVLHYHATGAKAWVPASQRGSLPIFPADLSSEPTAPENSTLSGSSEEMVEQKVDVFVNTEYVPLFSRSEFLNANLRAEPSPSTALPPKPAYPSLTL
jgi:nucleotide-sensitive chloride channel 1A